MKLPNRENAFIQPQKLVGYLLSETHSVGSSKAKLLRASGFNEENVDMLEQRLLDIARSQPVKEVVASPHGTKYVIEGEIEAPNGYLIELRTVWIIDLGQADPRFVTAHHSDEAQEVEMIQELDTVILTHDIQEKGLKAGDRGAVVHCYSDGKAFEVEFVNAEGQMIALLTLTNADIQVEAMQQKNKIVL